MYTLRWAWTVLLARLINGQCAGTTTISRNAQVTNIARCDTFAGSVVLGGDVNGSVSLNGISEITGSLSSTADLASLQADDLITIGKQLYIVNTRVLTSLQFPALKNVDTIELSGLPNLTEFRSTAGITNATDITVRRTGLKDLDWLQPTRLGTFILDGNPSLNKVDIPAERAAGYISLEENGPNLQASFPQLREGSNISIEDCESIDFPALSRVNLSISFVQNQIEEVKLPNLLLVENTFMIWNNSRLSTLEVPLLTNVSGDVVFSANPELREIELPELSRVEGDISANGSFTSFAMPALSDAQRNIDIRSRYEFDCSPLAAYDTSDVLKGQFNCISGTNSVPGDGNPSSAGGLSGGAKGGIAAGVVIGVLLVIGLLFLLRRRRRRARMQRSARGGAVEASDKPLSQADDSNATEVYQKAELDGEPSQRAELPAEHYYSRDAPNGNVSDSATTTAAAAGTSTSSVNQHRPTSEIAELPAEPYHGKGVSSGASGHGNETTSTLGKGGEKPTHKPCGSTPTEEKAPRSALRPSNTSPSSTTGATSR